MEKNMKKKYLVVFAFFATCLMLILPANYAVQGDPSSTGQYPSTNLFALSNLSLEEICAEFLNELGISHLTPEEVAILYRQEIESLTPEETNALYYNEYGVDLSILSPEDKAREAQARFSEGEQFITANPGNITDSYYQTGLNISEQGDTVMYCVIVGLLLPFGGPFYNMTCQALRAAQLFWYLMALALFAAGDIVGAELALLLATIFKGIADSLNCPPLGGDSLPINTVSYNMNTYNTGVQYNLINYGITGCPFCA